MSTRHDTSSKDRKRDKSGTADPELCLFQVPTYKPKTFKTKADLKDFKNDRAMDIRLFNEEIRFYQQGKKKVKRAINYSAMKEIATVDGSPELIQIIAKSKNKNKCYQFIVADDVNRKKLQEILESKRPQNTKQIPQTVTEPTGASEVTTKEGNDKVEGGTQGTYEDVSIKNAGFATSDFPKSRNPNSTYTYHAPTEYSYEEDSKNRSTKPRSAIRHGGTTGRSSDVGYDRKSRSTMFNLDYVDEDDDFESSNDQLIHKSRRRYPSSRQPGSSIYARSKFSYEPEYIDDDYDEQTSSYGYDDSEYSEETVTARPMKPRSLTFYTPFLRVPPTRAPFYS